MKLEAHVFRIEGLSAPVVNLHIGWDGQLYVETNMLVSDGVADIREHGGIAYINGQRSSSSLAPSFSPALKLFRAMEKG